MLPALNQATLESFFNKIGYVALLLSLCAIIAFAQTPHGDIFTDKNCPCCDKKEVKKSTSLVEETVIAEIESNDL